MVFLTTLINSAKRIPLIRFRKGGHSVGLTGSSATTAPGSAPSSNTRPASGQVIEDWELPERFRRRPIEQLECDHINSGGAV